MGDQLLVFSEAHRKDVHRMQAATPRISNRFEQSSTHHEAVQLEQRVRSTYVDEAAQISYN